MGWLFRVFALTMILLPSLGAAQSALTTSAGDAAEARREREAAQPQPAAPKPVQPATPPAPYVPELAGYWEGTLTQGDASMPVTLHIEKVDNEYQGTFDSDVLQIAGAPLGNVTFASPRGHWEITNDRITAIFDGTLKGDFIDGNFSEGSAFGRFHLTRSGPRQTPVTETAVTFKNGNVTLSGTLLVPTTLGPHRAVLLLQDAGDEARWVNRYLAQKFAEHGVIALIYDKRGVGQSSGNWKIAYFGALAEDAVAGIRFLQALPDVDPHYVGIYGHGEGGMIAPLVAEEAGNLDFVIAASASADAPEEAELYSMETAMNLPTLPPAERVYADAYARALIRFAYWRDNWDTLKVMIDEYKGRSWYFAPPAFTDHTWTFYYNTQGYRPLYHWDEVHARVLLAYGANDRQVPAQKAMADITEAVRDGDDGAHAFRTWLCLECDHDFVVRNRPSEGGWPQRSPDFANRLIDFVIYDRRP